MTQDEAARVALAGLGDDKVSEQVRGMVTSAFKARGGIFTKPDTKLLRKVLREVRRQLEDSGKAKYTEAARELTRREDVLELG